MVVAILLSHNFYTNCEQTRLCVFVLFLSPNISKDDMAHIDTIPHWHFERECRKVPQLDGHRLLLFCILSL